MPARGSCSRELGLSLDCHVIAAKPMPRRGAYHFRTLRPQPQCGRRASRRPEAVPIPET